MRILKEICSIPTAPFVEHRVIEYVEQFVRQRRKLRLSRDEHGNLLVELPGKDRRQPRWLFGAHIDHPGLVSRRMIDRRTVEADFRGYVLADYVQGAKVRFFEDGREIPGKVVHVEPDEGGQRAGLVRVRVAGEVSANVPGMFDQGEGRVKSGRFYSRVCDDLAGAAAALTMLDQLHADPPRATIAAFLTRAEEGGFVGALAAVQRPKLLKKSDRIVAIECSAMQPYAPQGEGPIIRIGDKTSIFNSSLTYFLTQRAEALKKKSKAFRYQRALMPGGTCEATVYDVYGYHASSICVALGNYHNMDRDRHRIGPEYIDVGDWKDMVKFFVAIARNAHEYREGHRALREQLEKRFAGLKRLLKPAP